MAEPVPRTRLRTRFKPVRLKLSSDLSKRPLERMSLHDQLVALGFLKHPVDLDQAFTNRFLIGATSP